MSDVSDATDILNLSSREIEAIIGYLVKYNRNVEKVKARMLSEFGKYVSQKVIRILMHKNDVLIDQKRIEFLAHPETRKFYHLADRLVEWEDLYDKFTSGNNFLCMQKTGRDDYTPYFGVNLGGAKDCLKLAGQDVRDTRRLELEESRAPGEDGADDEPSDLGFSFGKSKTA